MAASLIRVEAVNDAVALEQQFADGRIAGFGNFAATLREAIQRFGRVDQAIDEHAGIKGVVAGDVVSYGVQ